MLSIDTSKHRIAVTAVLVGFLFLLSFAFSVSFGNSSAPTASVVASISSPKALGYDSQYGRVLVASSASNKIFILQKDTYHIMGNASLGGTPTSVTYDSVDNQIYSADTLGDVSSINNDNFQVAASTTVAPPAILTYSSSLNLIYAASISQNSVSMIKGATMKIQNVINLPGTPSSLTLDSGNGYLYVTEPSANDVIAINSVNNATVATIPVGTDPQFIIAEGPVLYVANYGSNSISEIDTTRSNAIATISVGTGPDSIAYNAFDGCTYVSDYGSNTVSQICHGSVSSTINVGSEPDYVIYDPADYSIIVANFGSGTISEIPTPGASSISSSTTTSSTASNSQSGTLVTSTTTSSQLTGSYASNSQTGSSSNTNSSSSSQSLTQSSPALNLSSTSDVFFVLIGVTSFWEVILLIIFMRRRSRRTARSDDDFF